MLSFPKYVFSISISKFVMLVDGSVLFFHVLVKDA